MAHDVFVSYSSRDSATALAVVSALETAGIRCWMAPRDIKAGDGIGQHVAVAPADVVKFCGGEKHVYRLRRGSGENEHLSVYAYNPAVNANGPLRFEVRTTDAVQRRRVRPNSASTEPIASSVKSRVKVTGRSWSGSRPS
jgi:hypothetical protein